jgi:hypothetical protein
MKGDMYAELIRFLDRADVDAVVWIYINHAKKTGICFPNETQMGVGELVVLGCQSSRYLSSSTVAIHRI